MAGMKKVAMAAVKVMELEKAKADEEGGAIPDGVWVVPGDTEEDWDTKPNLCRVYKLFIILSNIF